MPFRWIIVALFTISWALPGCATTPKAPAGHAAQQETKQANEPDPEAVASGNEPASEPAVEPSSIKKPDRPEVARAQSPSDAAAATDHVRVAAKPPTEPAPQALTEVVDQLQAMGELDAVTRQQLLADLKQTNPALWPQLTQVFQASIAAKRRADAPQLEQASEPPAAQQHTPQATSVASKPQPVLPPTAPPTKINSPSNATEQSLPAAEKIIPATATVVEPPAVTTPPAQPPAPKAAASADSESIFKTPDKDWEYHLAEAIRGLEKETAGQADSTSSVSRHAALRLMYLVDGRREDALRPISGISASQQDFWSQELFGLATWLDIERNPDPGRRAAESNGHFRQAVARLGEQATLQIKNLTFCTEVSSFGVYKRFEKAEFQSGQEVLLYAEVENFKSVQNDRGYHTALKASYQILDEQGHRVAEHDFKVTEETCQNPRRDFFTNYFVWLPKRVYNGAYTLQLTIEDTHSQKIGQASIEFTVKEK